jgi:hypothetical protein
LPHVSGSITAWGPLLNVVIAVSAPRFDAIVKAGQTTPVPVVAKLLVDTGASQTSVDAGVLSRLSLTPTGIQPIHTPSTQGVPHVCNVFDVSIAIFGADATAPPVHLIPALPVLDGSFQSQGIDGLLGRDVLATAHMMYGGPFAWFVMSF